MNYPQYMQGIGSGKPSFAPKIPGYPAAPFNLGVDYRTWNAALVAADGDYLKAVQIFINSLTDEIPLTKRREISPGTYAVENPAREQELYKRIRDAVNYQDSLLASQASKYPPPTMSGGYSFGGPMEAQQQAANPPAPPQQKWGLNPKINPSTGNIVW